MLDHVSIGVGDYARSKAFYEAALAPLGFTVVMELGDFACGLGREGKPWFWVTTREPSGPLHLAFAAPDRPTVDAFHQAALAAGATDNGAPGLRDQYHRNYYGAFVLDPDGNNIEAVCHRPDRAAG
jgi:catechol 2,3-dioxygenase-like lactoylglutathione lyase family enzyme